MRYSETAPVKRSLFLNVLALVAIILPFFLVWVALRPLSETFLGFRPTFFEIFVLCYCTTFMVLFTLGIVCYILRDVVRVFVRRRH